MRVSVIVPIYNVRAFLAKCLDSLYIQAVEDMEIILVNDGSTDDSISICKKYAQTHSNTMIINKENGGLSDARNVGTKAATGDYIYYLDSDDWLAPDAIKTLCDYALSYNCEVVQGGFYYAYDNYLLYDKNRKSQVLTKDEAMHELVKSDCIKDFAWGKLYRTDVIKKHLFPKGKFYEDSYWQHLIVHECKRYGIVSTPLYYYRQRESGISGRFSERNLDLLKGYEERLEFVKSYYPKYTKEMFYQFWDNFYMLFQLSRTKENRSVANIYQNYWCYVKNTYNEELEKYMRYNLQYLIIRYLPSFTSCYYMIEKSYKRIVGQFQTHRLSKIMNK